jgi:hypothetical protein
MENVEVAQAVVDEVQVIAVLRGDKVTVLTNLAGPLTEVGRGRWDGTRFVCSAWLGRDDEHGAMVHAAIETALAACKGSRASGDLGTKAQEGAMGSAR